MGLAEVTITLEDAELAEAARFVLEGASAASEGANGAAPLLTDAPSAGATEPTSEFLPLDAPPSQNTVRRHPASDDIPEVAVEMVPESEFLKGKRGRRMPRVGAGLRSQEKCGQPAAVPFGAERVFDQRQSRTVATSRNVHGVGRGPDSYAIIDRGALG